MDRNPITSLAWKAPRTVQTIDRWVVINLDQARTLLDAVAVQKPSGALLVAFFGAMYYAALRPSEASTLRKSNLALPADGWGELVLGVLDTVRRCVDRQRAQPRGTPVEALRPR